MEVKKINKEQRVLADDASKYRVETNEKSARLTSLHGLLVLFLGVLVVVAPVDGGAEALVAAATPHHPDGGGPVVAVAADHRLFVLHLHLLDNGLQGFKARRLFQSQRRTDVPRRSRCRSNKQRLRLLRCRTYRTQIAID